MNAPGAGLENRVEIEDQEIKGIVGFIVLPELGIMALQEKNKLAYRVCQAFQNLEYSVDFQFFEEWRPEIDVRAVKTGELINITIYSNGESKVRGLKDKGSFDPVALKKIMIDAYALFRENDYRKD